MKKTFLLFLVSSSLFSSLANSQETNKKNIEEQSPSLTLETITVIATKSSQNSFDIPGMVSVINGDEPSVKGSTNLKQYLQNVAGLEFIGSSRRNGQDISLRGYNSDGIVFLVDGVRQRFNSAHDGKFFIDPNLLKKVEVVKGPYSTLYGSGGLGGVISFETKDAVDLLRKGENKGAITSAGYNSVNQERMISQTGFGVYDKFDILGQVTNRNSSNIKLGGGGELKSDDEVFNGLIKLGYNIDDYSKVKISLQGLRNDAVEPNNPQVGNDDSLSGNLTNKKTTNLNNSISYTYNNPNDNLLKLNLKLYQTKNEVEEEILVATQFNQIGDKTLRTQENFGFIVDNQSKFGDKTNFSNVVTYGLEFFDEKLESLDSRNGEVGGVPNASANFFGSFVQDEIKIKNQHIPGFVYVIPGVRFDKYKSKNSDGLSQDESAVSPKLGLTYKPVEELMLFGNYAKGFRAPNLGEIYSQGRHFAIPGIGTNNFVANTNLKPEKNESVEFGFGLNFKDIFAKKDQFQLKTSYYQINSEDYIEANVEGFVGGGPFASAGQTISRNINSASLQGNEVEISYENNRIKYNFSYAYINGKNDETNEYLTNITPRTYKNNIMLKLPEFNSSIGFRSTFATKHKNVNDDEDKRSGFGTHDLYYELQANKDLNINFGIDNIFDKKFERVFAGAVEPGRNFRTNISYRW